MEFAKLADRALGAGQQCGLGHLEFQAPRVEAGILERRADVVDERHGAELNRRQVHRKTAVRRPARRIGTGAVQHPAANRDDQASLLGDGDELGRRNAAAFGVVPAQERLEPDDVAGANRKERLVMECELVIADGAGEVAADLASGREVFRHFGGIEAASVAPLRLGSGEGDGSRA